MSIKNSLIKSSTLAVGLLTGISLLCAQDATTPIGTAPSTQTNLDWNSLSDAQIELMAIEQVQPTPYSQLPENDKMGGTFWSAQHSPLSSVPWPPLPIDLMHLSVWSLSTNNEDQGVFMVDDRAVNYDSLSTQSATMQPLDSTSPPGPGDTNGYSTNSGPIPLDGIMPIDTNGLWLQINGVSNGLV